MGAILGFHSFTSPGLPADGDAHVPLERFKDIVRVARRLGEIVPLDTLVRRHREGRSTAGLVAVTLDDAYAALTGDFATFIDAAHVPVSVFVVIDAAAHGTSFWWDRVDDAASRVSPDEWREFERACGVPDEYRASQPAAYGPVRPLRQWMLARHAGRWPRHLEPALDRLTSSAGYETKHRAMTFEELDVFARRPAVDLGVHTVTHPVLPLLSDEEIEREVGACHDRLRAAFPRVVPMLAFPFALFDRRAVAAARSAGMAACLTLSGDTVGAAADAGALPRICVTARDTALRVATRLMGLPAFVRACTGRARPEFPDLPSAAT